MEIQPKQYGDIILYTNKNLVLCGVGTSVIPLSLWNLCLIWSLIFLQK